MKNYEYPRVRPPTSLQPPQNTTAPVRFSWMETPADEENRLWEHNTGRERKTSSPAPAVQQMQNMEVPQGSASAQHPYHIQDPTVVQQHPYHIQNPAVVQHQHQQHQHVQDPRFPSAYSTQHIPVQVLALPTPSSAQEQQQPPNPQPPDPVKQSSSDNKPSVPISPDANPLVSPIPRGLQRASTNMAIVPPSANPAQFSIGVYTPSPQAIKGGSWQHGLCSCAEPSICLTGLFCPCIVYGKAQYRLSLRGERKDPTNMLGYNVLNGSCLAFAILCGINGFLSAIQHTRVRKTYNMNTEAGNVPGDCVKGFCCCCCAVAQNEKEVKFREEQARKPEGASNNQTGYVAPAGMTFSPPPR